MKRTGRISLIILIITVISIAVSVIFLPDTVRVQGSVITGTATYLPKLWAILLAAVLSLTGSVGIQSSKKPEPAKYTTLMISAIGIILFAYMLLANCIP